MEVDPQQLCVVIEHLLEMRHHPCRVDRVPGEATGELVVHAAARHRLAGSVDHLDRPLRPGTSVVAHEKLENHGRREFRRRAEAAVLRVISPSQTELGLVQFSCVDGTGSRRDRDRLQGRHDARTRGQHLVLPFGPGLGSRGQQPQKALLGKVRSGEEGLAGRSEQAGHRPAALAGHRGRCRHVDRVDIRALLTIHLDRHEGRVEHGCNLGIFERLVRHHVAPMAGGIAHAEKHRHVATAGFNKCLGTPLPPVHWIVGVLSEIRTGRFGEAVGHYTNLRPAIASGIGNLGLP